MLAIFKAAEAANDALQKNSKLNRLELAKEEYGAWLVRLAADSGLVAEGHGFEVKTKSDGSKWTIEASIEGRANDILKKHKEIMYNCRRSLMPAYFQFFQHLGKYPSGTERDDAIRVVKEAAWKLAD